MIAAATGWALAALALAASHPFHVSIAELELNRRTKRLEVALRVFPDDLESALSERAGRAVSLDEGPGLDTMIERYLESTFEARRPDGSGGTGGPDGPDGPDARDGGGIEWVGKEVSLKAVWLYFELPFDGELHGAHLSNRIFFGLFDDQVNSVNLRDGRVMSTVQFTPGAPWRTIVLRGMPEDETTASAAPGPGPNGGVALHHLRLAIDPATFDDMLRSAFLRDELAGVDLGRRWLADPDPEIRRLFIRGRTTTLELVCGEGPTDLLFAVDLMGELERLAPAIGACAGSPLEIRLEPWNTAAARPLPWRYVADVPLEVPLDPGTIDAGTVHVSVVEYHRDFLPTLYPLRHPAEVGVRRADVQAPLFRDDRLLRDVAGVTIALREPDRRRLEACLACLPGSPGNHHGITIVSAAADKRPGLRGMRLELIRNKAGRQVYRFGPRSILSFFPDRTAVWSFAAGD